MAHLELLLTALDSVHRELGEAFKGLPDDAVWVRPAPTLLSIGELAAHVGYWEAQSFLGNEFESPLAVEGARYYTSNVEQAIRLPMGAEAVFAELTRIHEAAKVAFVANRHDSEEPNPYRGDWTWGYTLEYQVFHLAYHAGQMYSVRHLLGHEPVDN